MRQPLAVSDTRIMAGNVRHVRCRWWRARAGSKMGCGRHVRHQVHAPPTAAKTGLVSREPCAPRGGIAAPERLVLGSAPPGERGQLFPASRSGDGGDAHTSAMVLGARGQGYPADLWLPVPGKVRQLILRARYGERRRPRRQKVAMPWSHDRWRAGTVLRSTGRVPAPRVDGTELLWSRSLSMRKLAPRLVP